MNLIRILAALLAVGVLVGCEQAAEEPMTEVEPAAESSEEAAEEPMTELEAAEGGEGAAEEPMTELEPAEGGEGAAEAPMTELEPAEGGEEAAEDDGGETADDAMDASEMPADADDG